MKLRKSLSLKIFITVFIVFAIMASFMVFYIDIYFNRFYEGVKIDNTIDNINSLIDSYKRNDWDMNRLYKQADIFSSENNATIVIKPVEDSEGNGEEGEEDSEPLVLVTTRDGKDNYIDFFLSKETFSGLAIEKGSTIRLEGYYGEDNVLYVSRINNKTINTPEISNGKEFSGDVTVVDIRNNLALPSSEEESDIEYNYLETKEKDGVKYSISEIPNTGIKQVIFTKAITSNGKAYNVIVTASLQPILEVVKVIKGFYPIFFVSSLILAFIVGLIYSSRVIKPISKITIAADDMAKMKFNTILPIDREDELGILSGSLNTLSNNLDHALQDLKQANEKLKYDYEKEVKQEQARKEFIANASHELKTPLGIIRSYSEAIKDNINNRERDAYIDTMHDEINRMDKLITEMLRISRYDSMDMTVNRQEYDMLVLINDAIQGFERQMQLKKLRLDIRGDFNICYIDVEKIQTSFLNIFSNAVKYADKNSTIIISGVRDNHRLRVEIYNKHIGFTQDQLERIWERFYRIDTSHNKEIEGTGLGLSIVKSIFEVHEIKYGVENRDDGVVFWFELPECRDEQ